MTNLTPHQLNLEDVNGDIITFPVTKIDGEVLTVRANTIKQELEPLQGFPFCKTEFGKPVFMLGKAEFFGVVPPHPPFVVSALALAAIKANGGLEQWEVKDFVTVGELVRDEEGRITHAKGLSC